MGTNGFMKQDNWEYLLKFMKVKFINFDKNEACLIHKCISTEVGLKIGFTKKMGEITKMKNLHRFTAFNSFWLTIDSEK